MAARKVRPGIEENVSVDLVLRLPGETEEAEFLRAHRATSPSVPSFLHYYEEGMPFRRYLEVLTERARGENLPPSHVASTFLFAFAGSTIVGRVAIRHSLNAYLEQIWRAHRLRRRAGVPATGLCHGDPQAVARDRRPRSLAFPASS